MSIKTCTHCGERFKAKYENAKLCFDCWKDRERAFEQNALLSTTIRRLERDVMLQRHRAEVAEARAALADATTPRASSSSPSIPDDIRRLLRLLCHPDKHGGSPASTKATAWLNGARP